jgi:ketosteroid isomerase-like protein
MQRTVLILLGLFSSLAMADVTDDVRCREIGFSQSIENKDIEAFKAFLDADARFISNRARRGVDEIAEGWSNFTREEGPSIRWRPIYVEVLDDGKLALSRGVYEAASTAEDGSETMSYGSFNSVWRLNDDGVWRVVFDAGDRWPEGPTEEELAVLNAEDECGD